jgi:hypothetical protein
MRKQNEYKHHSIDYRQKILVAVADAPWVEEWHLLGCYAVWLL